MKCMTLLEIDFMVSGGTLSARIFPDRCFLASLNALVDS